MRRRHLLTVPGCHGTTRSEGRDARLARVIGEYLARLKAEQPNVDWDAAMAAARKRRDRARRNPWNRIVHRVHAMRHPEQHRERCSCGEVARRAQLDKIMDTELPRYSEALKRLGES